jgi:pimeloyl-ACP methyl ester carboxylesterase
VTVLWFHGNAGNIGSRVAWLRDLHAATGYSILLFDYRGYGWSDGRSSEAGLYRDAEAVLAHLRSDARVDPERIVYFGRSLGSAVAVELATRHPPMALVIETPFPSLRWLAHEVYPWLPVTRWLHESYDSEARAQRIDAPALVIHGARDEVAPVDGARRVADAFAGEVELYVVPGARHNDIPAVAGEAYYRRLVSFVERALAAQSP